jgi:hypothetical protein
VLEPAGESAVDESARVIAGGVGIGAKDEFASPACVAQVVCALVDVERHARVALDAQCHSGVTLAGLLEQVSANCPNESSDAPLGRRFCNVSAATRLSHSLSMPLAGAFWIHFKMSSASLARGGGGLFLLR